MKIDENSKLLKMDENWEEEVKLFVENEVLIAKYVIKSFAWVQ